MLVCPARFLVFPCPTTSPTESYTLSLHDALPIFAGVAQAAGGLSQYELTLLPDKAAHANEVERIRHLRGLATRSEEHTSELQSPCNLVCRLLLEKKKNRQQLTLRIDYQNWTVYS